MAPLFRDFAARYHKRRRHRWKPSTLETFDIYLRSRLMPHFGRLRLDAIDHARGRPGSMRPAGPVARYLDHAELKQRSIRPAMRGDPPIQPHHASRPSHQQHGTGMTFPTGNRRATERGELARYRDLIDL